LKKNPLQIEAMICVHRMKQKLPLPNTL